MTQYTLPTPYYCLPTPAGTYVAASGGALSPARRFLMRLLGGESAPLVTEESLAEWTGLEDADALELFYRLQGQALVEGFADEVVSPSGPLEQVLPSLLKTVSSKGKALLADNMGFYVTSVGFPHETAEELSALSAGLTGLYARHEKLLLNNAGVQSKHWSLVDAAGNSEIGFWQLHIGEHRFSLVIAGMPQFNQSSYTQLVWSLAKRYLQAA